MKRIVRLTESDLTRIVRRTLNELSDITIADPEMDVTKTSMGGNEGLSLECVKINYKNPEDSEISYAGPYPWKLVQYNKKSRPVKMYLYRKDKPRDVVWGGGNDPEMILHFEEITDRILKSALGVDKKYVMATDNSPGVVGPQYCRVDGEMDTLWDENFFSYEGNDSVIEPYPDFSEFE